MAGAQPSHHSTLERSLDGSGDADSIVGMDELILERIPDPVACMRIIAARRRIVPAPARAGTGR